MIEDYFYPSILQPAQATALIVDKKRSGQVFKHLSQSFLPSSPDHPEDTLHAADLLEPLRSNNQASKIPLHNTYAKCYERKCLSSDLPYLQCLFKNNSREDGRC